MKISLASLIVLLSSLSVFPCSVPYISPWRFDISQYVFVGQITQYVETTELVNKRQTPAEAGMYGKLADRTAGVVVKVKQNFYTPTVGKPTYEIYRFSLGADCGLYGLPLDWMKERYKLGDWVGVVAGKSTHIAESGDPGVGRLEVRYGKNDWITPIKQDDPSLRDISSAFDYKAYRTNLIGDPTFELLKDLRRISLGDQKERKSILDRLTYYPRFCENCHFYLEGVFETYSTDMDEFARYAELVRERAMTDTEFKQFQERRKAKNP